jgi:hypothetical protein
MIAFDAIWSRIKSWEGETFHQIRGGPFTYTVTGSALVPDRTNQNIRRPHFEEAFRLLPLKSTVPIQHLRGPVLHLRRSHGPTIPEQ